MSAASPFQQHDSNSMLVWALVQLFSKAQYRALQNGQMTFIPPISSDLHLAFWVTEAKGPFSSLTVVATASNW